MKTAIELLEEQCRQLEEAKTAAQVEATKQTNAAREARSMIRQAYMGGFHYSGNDDPDEAWEEWRKANL